MKKGLVLEGGGMRGMFTAGVLDVMMEQGITFDNITGVSAGAVFGCNMKSKQIGRSLRYNLRFCKDKRYCSWYSLFKTGDMFGVKFCYHDIPEKLDIFDTETFKNNSTEFYTVSTNVETGRPDYHKCYDGKAEDLEYIRASASLPLVSRAVKIDGKPLFDGGISDSIPVRFAQRLGNDKIVIVLTQPKEYRKKSSKSTLLFKLLIKEYPKIYKLMKNRPSDYNRTVRYIRQLEREGKVFVIRPEKAITAGRIEHDRKELSKAYLEGRKAMRKNFVALKKFLETA